MPDDSAPLAAGGPVDAPAVTDDAVVDALRVLRIQVRVMEAGIAELLRALQARGVR